MKYKNLTFIIVLLMFQFVKLSMADHPHGITSDGLLGTEVTLDNKVYNISNGTGKGNNLFHSFEKFNLHKNESAVFNDTGYQNTISRVTGTDYSWINGKIKSMAENFYLLNPNGVMFGSNVSLDVAGSFHASTCEFLEFNPDEKFYTSGLESSVLSTAPPTSFGFLNNDVGPISMDNSVLMVADQKTISLIGGNIDSTYGYLFAPSGQINIAGVKSPGYVSIAPDNMSVSSEIKGDISLIATYVEVAGDNPGRIFVQSNDLLASDFTFFLADNSGTQGDGKISVNANNIQIVDSGFYATTYGEGNAGEISLHAQGDITISGLQSNLDVSAQSNSSGKSGDILISANNLLIDEAIIKNRPENNTGGQVKIETTSDITINKGGFFLETLDFDGGDLFISGNNITINDGNFMMYSFSSGHAGNLEINAKDTLQISGLASINLDTRGDKTGNAGDISLIAGKDLIIKDGVNISSSVYHMSKGKGGKILLQAGESLTLQGNDYENRVQIDVNNYDEYNAYYLPGNAGSLEMRAKNISLLDYVRIDASTSYLNYAHIQSNPSDDNNPDDPEHYPNDNKGKGGFVHMIAEESITLKGNGDLRLIPIEIVPNRKFVWEKKVEYPVHIDMSSYGTGHAGELNMEGKNISIYDDVKIDGYAGFIGDGPTIRFNASENLLLNGTKEAVYFESIINNHSFDIWAFPVDIDLKSVWRGKSGTLHMDAKNVFLKDYVSINMNSYGIVTARSGNIYINAEEDFRIEGISTEDYITLIDIGCVYRDTFNYNMGIIKASAASGTLSIKANNILLSNAKIQSRIGEEIVFEYGLAGEIKFEANNMIKFDNTRILNEIKAQYLEIGYGKTHDNAINLIANEIVFENCHLKGSSYGGSPAGDITLVARKKISIFDSNIISSLLPIQGYSTVKGITVAGKILIKTPVFELYDSTIMAKTEARGNGGNILISGYHDNELNEEQNEIYQACNLVKLKNSILNSQSNQYVLWDLQKEDGDAGNIIIASKNFELDNSSLESFSLSHGKGGLIGIGKLLSFDKENKSVAIIEPSDYISLNKKSTITTAGLEEFSGQAGSIDLGAKALMLNNQSDIISSTNGENKAGEINIYGSKLLLSKSSSVTTSSEGKGNAGNINLHIETLHLSGNSEIVSDSDAEIDGGTAGTIHIGREIVQHADDQVEIINPCDKITLIENSRIATDAHSSGGGKVKIMAKDTLYMTNSTISTNVKDGTGQGGDIQIDPEFVILNHSNISANAIDGDGGAVYIVADYFIKSMDSRIEATSERGNEGSVKIEAPDIDISSALSNMASDFLDASQWIKTPCAARAEKKLNISRLIVRGRDATPTATNDLIASPIFPVNELQEIENTNIYTLIIEGENAYSKGNIVLAAQSWEKALQLSSPESTSYLTIVEHLSHAYQSLGFHKNALILCQKALTVAEKNQHIPQTILFHNAFSDLLLSMGNLESSIIHVKTALKLARRQKKRLLTASVMNHVANAMAVDGNFETGIRVYDKSLSLLNKNSDFCKNLKAVLLMNLTYTISKTGTYEDTIAICNESFNHIQTLADNHHKGFYFIHLCQMTWQINEYFPNSQKDLLASPASLLHRAQQIGEIFNDNKILSMSNGYAGQLFEEAKQYEAAIQKTRAGIFYADQNNNHEILYLWQWQLGRLFKKIGQEKNAIDAYKTAISTLSGIREELFSGLRMSSNVFETRVKPVYMGLSAIYLDQEQRLSDVADKESKMIMARNVMESLKNAELSDYFEDECVTKNQKKNTQTLDRTPEGIALLYPIALTNHLSILLTLPDSIKHYQVDVSYEKLNKVVKTYRRQIQTRTSNEFLSNSQLIYKWIIQPLEKDIQTANIHTLLVAPDGVLRLIPFSSLHDSKKFLVEKYAVVTIPAINLVDMSDYKKKGKDILVSGLSDAVQGFSALPSVNDELKDIRKIMNGKNMYLNNEYTINRIKDEFKTKDYGIVHFATHGVFGDTGKDSFLLTYNKQLDMNNLENLMSMGKYRNHQVDLLTLSACQTALGNERAALGLAGVAVKAGVRSAIATLWYVDDQATSLAIRELYRQLRKKDMSKAKALQNAQKMLIGQQKYWHPVYWAPFLLIGSWT
ncbi:secreted protein containing Filamentous hemagglutinin [Candidatus Magnetomorum sp. HK-1]|nr:secreted protein containing Filamentous hemagglutinin [Candidatus Magnetomorum sp. HK-1]